MVDQLTGEVSGPRGRRERLGTQELRLLDALARARGRVLSRDALRAMAWPEGVEPRAVDTAMRRLRARLEVDPRHPRYLRTVAGAGYVLAGEVPGGGSPGEAPVEAPWTVGREEELGRIVAWTRGGGRLLTLTGPGGVGKTQLALCAAAATGARFCDLSTAREARDLVVLVTSALALPLRVGASSARDAVGAALALRGPALLVLDNLEQVRAEARDTLAAWLERAPDLRVLATSREALGAPGEEVLEVPPLPAPHAIALFRARAAATPGALALQPSDEPDIAALVERLDRLPLAIQLAASRVAGLTPGEILRRLELGGPLPGREEQGGRQASMAAAVAWSWALLSAEEAELLMALSLFRGGFVADEAAEVAGLSPARARRLLGRLRERALILSAPDGRDYRLYEHVRRYAASRRSDLSRGPALALRYRRATLARAERLLGALERDEGPLLELERLRPDLEEIHQESLAAAPGASLRAALALARLQRVRGPYDASRLDAAVARCPDAGLRAMGLLAAAELLFRASELDAGVSRLDARDALLSGQEDPDAPAAALLRSRLAGARGDFAEVRRLAEEVLETATRPRERVAALAELGNALARAGEIERAIALFEESAIEAERCGDRPGFATASFRVGHLHSLRGDRSGAERTLERAVVAWAELGDRRGEAYCHLCLAEDAVAHGDLKAARDRVSRAERAFRDAGVGAGVGECALLLAAADLAEGAIELAEARYRQALHLLAAAGAANAWAARLGLGGALLRQGRGAEAEPLLQSCRDHARTAGWDHMGACAVSALLLAAERRRDEALALEALEDLERALPGAALRDPDLAWCVAEAAGLAEAAGAPERARRILDLLRVDAGDKEPRR